LPTSCAKAVARKETGVHVSFHTRIIPKTIHTSSDGFRRLDNHL
jgi:hypothetical protein